MASRERSRPSDRPPYLHGPDGEQQVQPPPPHHQRQQHGGSGQRQAAELVPDIELPQAAPGLLHEPLPRSGQSGAPAPSGRGPGAGIGTGTGARLPLPLRRHRRHRRRLRPARPRPDTDATPPLSARSLPFPLPFPCPAPAVSLCPELLAPCPTRGRIVPDVRRWRSSAPSVPCGPGRCQCEQDPESAAFVPRHRIIERGP